MALIVECLVDDELDDLEGSSQNAMLAIAWWD
jgi:hypothetical protein